MSAIGVDLGTKACHVAVARQGGIETISNEYSDRASESLVSFGEKRRFIGSSAKGQVITNAKNTLAMFKSLIGRKFSDPYVQKLRESLSYDLVEMQGDKIGIRVSFLGEVEILSPEHITAIFLRYLRSMAEASLKMKVSDMVLSVPSFFTDAQRRALLDAASIAGVKCLRLLNDTTASGLAYGIYKKDLPAIEEPPRHVVFVDMGYTSLQVALIGFNKGKLVVKAKAFDPAVGGRDFDWRLAQHFDQEFKKKYKIDSLSRVRQRLRLLTECEKLKKTMSSNANRIPLTIESFFEERDVSGSFQRSEFEELCSDLLKRVKDPLLAVLAQAKLTKEDIHSVEIIGGSTRIPAIKEVIEQVFGKPPSTTLNQVEAVARGCALQAAILSPTFRVRDFEIIDIQPYPIRIQWTRESDDETGEMVLFQKNSHISSSKVLTMYRKAPFVFEASYLDFTEQEHPLGTFTINGVVPTTAGEPSKVKVKARSNANGIFSIISATLYEKVEEMDLGSEENKESTGQREGTTEDAMQTADSKEATDEGQPSSEPQNTEGGEMPSPDQQPSSAESPPGSENKEAPEEQPKNGDQPKTEGQPEATATPKEDNGMEGAKPPEKKKKKQVKVIDLSVDGITSSFSNQELNLAEEKEGKMASQDRKEIDKAEARNAVEEYVYEMREKLAYSLEEFISQEDKEEFTEILCKTEDWLYDEGEDETKSVYQQKLAEMKKLGDPVIERHREFEERPEAMDALAKSIVHFEKIVEQYKKKDELYDHIEGEEMAKVSREVEVKRGWHEEKSKLMTTLPKSVNFPVKVSEIKSQKQTLESICNPIVSKPKPKQEPPPEEKAAEEGSQAKPTEGEKGEQKPTEEPKPNDMDDKKQSVEDMDID